jgi:hypothetical protein
MTEALCLAAALALAQPEKPAPPPLTEEQRTKIGKLANDTQKEAGRLKGLLEERQKELAAVYARYELDEKRAMKLETEILDLQRQMLANYRKMQVELRTLIGEDRFTILKQRLDRFLQPPAEKAPGKEKPPAKKP